MSRELDDNIPQGIDQRNKDIYNFFIPHLRNSHFIFINLHANVKEKKK